MDYKLFETKVNIKQALLLCQQFHDYRGLERSVPYAHELLSANTIKELLGMVDIHGDIPYSFENFRKLHAIREKLITKGLTLDIILIGQPPTDDFRYKFVNLLGFDISGESLCHSSIYRCYFDGLHIASNSHVEFYEKLNQNGLFSDAATAHQFIEYISILSHHFENDKDIAPIGIWELIV